jgi:hypothetical protein
MYFLGIGVVLGGLDLDFHSFGFGKNEILLLFKLIDTSPKHHPRNGFSEREREIFETRVLDCGRLGSLS